MEIVQQTVFTAGRYPAFGNPEVLQFSFDRVGQPSEGGRVSFAWGKDGLYVRAELEDSNLVVLNPADEQLHYETGDVFEIFVKPKNENYYWEMYATPTGHKSTLFFPPERRGMDVNDFLHDHHFRGLEVGAERTHSGWNAEMFVPVGQLTALGARWDEWSEWTVLCGRYNYNTPDLNDPQLSMAPVLSSTNFHLTREYAVLHLGGHAI